MQVTQHTEKYKSIFPNDTEKKSNLNEHKYNPSFIQC